MRKKPPSTINVFGVDVSTTSYADAVETVGRWVDEKTPRYVCVCPVYNIMLARSAPEYRDVLNNADMVTPDGAPVAAFMRLSGNRTQERVRGISLTLEICRAAAEKGHPVFLYGVTDEKLLKVEENLVSRFPGLKIAGRYAPPFRPLTDDEDNEITKRIQASGARVLFVAIGTPRQEYWMAVHKDRLNCVQVGVGAAFDILSGSVMEAPVILQRTGLEWAFRLAMEPGRLFRRYAVHNPRFLALSLLRMFNIDVPPARMP